MKTNIKMIILVSLVFAATMVSPKARDRVNPAYAKFDRCKEQAFAIYQQCMGEQDAADYPTIYAVCQLQFNKQSAACDRQLDWDIEHTR